MRDSAQIRNDIKKGFKEGMEEVQKKTKKGK